MDWLNVAERLGIPVAVLAAVAIALWKIGKFLAPHLSGFFTRHTELIESLKGTTERQTDLLEGQTTQLKAYGETLATHGKTLEEHGGLIREIHEHVRRGQA